MRMWERHKDYSRGRNPNPFQCRNTNKPTSFRASTVIFTLLDRFKTMLRSLLAQQRQLGSRLALVRTFASADKVCLLVGPPTPDLDAGVCSRRAVAGFGG